MSYSEGLVKEFEIQEFVSKKQELAQMLGELFSDEELKKYLTILRETKDRDGVAILLSLSKEVLGSSRG